MADYDALVKYQCDYIQRTDAENIALDERVTQLLGDVKDIQAKLKDRDTEVALQTKLIQRLGAENADLSDQVAHMTKYIKSLKIGRSERDTEIVRLDKVIVRMSQANIDHAGELRERDMEIADLRERVSQVGGKRGFVSTETMDTKTHILQAEIARLTQQVDESKDRALLEKQISRLEKLHSEKDECILSLRSIADTSCAKTSRLANQVDYLQQRLGVLTRRATTSPNQVMVDFDKGTIGVFRSGTWETREF